MTVDHGPPENSSPLSSSPAINISCGVANCTDGDGGGSTTPITTPVKPIMSVLSELQKYADISQHGHVAFKDSQWQLTKSRHLTSSTFAGGVVMTGNTSYQALMVREELRARFRLFSTATADRRQHQERKNLTATKDRDDENNDPGELLDESTPTTSANGDDDARTSSMPQKKDEVFCAWKLKDVVEHRRRIYHEDNTARDTNAIAASVSVKQSAEEEPAESPDGLCQRNKATANRPVTPLCARGSHDEEGSWTMIQADDTAGYPEEDGEIDGKYLYVDDDEKRLFQKDPIELFGAGGGGSLKSSRNLKVAQAHARRAIEYYVEAAHHAVTVLTLLNLHRDEQQQLTKQNDHRG